MPELDRNLKDNSNNSSKQLHEINPREFRAKTEETPEYKARGHSEEYQ